MHLPIGPFARVRATGKRRRGVQAGPCRARSAFRPERLPDRTEANVATAKTNVPTAVPQEAQAMVPITPASPFDHLHLLLVVVFAGSRGKLVESVDLLRTELDRVRTDILLHPGHVLGAGNRRDVVPLR